jgi:hypothetical protein
VGFHFSCPRANAHLSPPSPTHRRRRAAVLAPWARLRRRSKTRRPSTRTTPSSSRARWSSKVRLNRKLFFGEYRTYPPIPPSHIPPSSRYPTRRAPPLPSPPSPLFSFQSVHLHRPSRVFPINPYAFFSCVRAGVVARITPRMLLPSSHPPPPSRTKKTKKPQKKLHLNQLN